MAKKHKIVKCKVESINKFNNQITMSCGKRILNARGKGANWTTNTKQMKIANDHILICTENEEF
ncbi:hypothetical protein [Mycoplasma todarodis]|uniref:Uncharacterized protein n=1 Tax=Mycoplasma todarodis TaxID=1937191 RepID=A0A4R0XUT7_9MOLU|nr:hypothetical protein [Mycoplasma todarodis]TCG11577.1 hypothetical protein C4B25_01185 [Mycoplasma todarodis]